MSRLFTLAPGPWPVGNTVEVYDQLVTVPQGSETPSGGTLLTTGVVGADSRVALTMPVDAHGKFWAISQDASGVWRWVAFVHEPFTPFMHGTLAERPDAAIVQDTLAQVHNGEQDVWYFASDAGLGAAGELQRAVDGAWIPVANLGTGANVQIFSAESATWTKPAGAQHVRVLCIGGGGAGCAGESGAASNLRGGGGGGGGGVQMADLFAVDLAATVAVIAGAGGAGGVAGVSSGLGSAGGSSQFGALVKAGGGGQGGNGVGGGGGALLSGSHPGGGQPVSADAATRGIGSQSTPGNSVTFGIASEFGGAAGGSCQAGSNGNNGGDSIYGGPGGGGGGGVDSSNVATNGHAGGGNLAYIDGSGATAGVGSATAPTAGANGATGPSPYCGQGGGGGGSKGGGTGTGAKGGNGGIGAGGGGGGAGATGGGGGDGGPGRVIVVAS